MVDASGARVELPAYSSDYDAVREVLDKIASKPSWWPRFVDHLKAESPRVAARPDLSPTELVTARPASPLAICRAALKTVL